MPFENKCNNSLVRSHSGVFRLTPSPAYRCNSYVFVTISSFIVYDNWGFQNLAFRPIKSFGGNRTSICKAIMWTTGTGRLVEFNLSKNTFRFLLAYIFRYGKPFMCLAEIIFSAYNVFLKKPKEHILALFGA